MVNWYWLPAMAAVGWALGFGTGRIPRPWKDPQYVKGLSQSIYVSTISQPAGLKIDVVRHTDKGDELYATRFLQRTELE